ncbi:helix-turn-helix transcriptional regulator [Magnetospirillum sp. 64-120]|uniref:AraC family transcriptional regulator n=1 Tax=Magnetospirillum sp. 64-120 TaxID=1895778 RepID=UPI000AA4BF2D|nr:helix-turn-helix transcriptional regulator [Magnetospirillum sp. 64-120]
MGDTPLPPPLGYDGPPSSDQHLRRIEWVEALEGAIVPLASDYADRVVVPPHRHKRAQLLYALTGIITVTTEAGRWMVPPDHALWVPAGMEHSVAPHGRVRMHSIYVSPGAVDLPPGCRVVEVTPLMHGLIVEAVKLPRQWQKGSRADKIMALVVEELPLLPERPLGLPMPADERLAALCHDFIATPDPHATIDDWAKRLATSRRSFTRLFRQQTGLGLAAWRQQATLFAALPRLAAGEAVTTVAIDLGYDSVAAFTTMFKRLLGAPPSRYLRQSPMA